MTKMKQLDTSIILFFLFLNGVFGFVPGAQFLFDQVNSLTSSSNQSNNAYSPATTSSKKMKSFTFEGDSLTDDFIAIRSLNRINRNRIPPRLVHAKGITAYGVFRVTNAEISSYTKAALFNRPGKETRVAVRFSNAFGEPGSSDTNFLNMRGMSIKFYTEEGVYDQLCINMPVFFINDPQFFTQLVHAIRRDRRTGLFNANNFWDFFSLRPETLNSVSLLFTEPTVLPDGFRHIPAFSVNAFRLTNQKEKHFYAKFYWTPNQGVRNLNLSEALLLAGTDPDYAQQDLIQAIENKNFPSWTLHAQIITLEDIHKHFNYNPFDATKLWPKDKFPLVEVGTLELNSNVRNFFAENEQIAFNPANLVSGIESSPDRLLKGRLFSYTDAHFYRLGVNYLTIPVNREPSDILSERDGKTRTDGNHYDTPNYYPNSDLLDQPNLYGIVDSPFSFAIEDVVNLMPDSLQQQYEHARDIYSSHSEKQKLLLHRYLAFSLSGITKRSILNRMFKHLAAINPVYAEGVRKEIIRQQKSSLIN